MVTSSQIIEFLEGDHQNNPVLIITEDGTHLKIYGFGTMKLINGITVHALLVKPFGRFEVED